MNRIFTYFKTCADSKWLGWDNLSKFSDKITKKSDLLAKVDALAKYWFIEE